MTLFHGVYVVCVLMAGLKLTDGQCTWPSPFVSSTWKDNARGNLVFTTNTMSGWSFTKDSQVINQWQCTNVDTFNIDGIIIMRSVNTFIQFVTTYYYAYLCLKMTPITSVSYRYYVLEPEQNQLNYDRYLVSVDGTFNTTAKACYPSYGATGGEYKVMIKSGQESSAAITCPWILLGKFDYTHTTAAGTATCTTGGNTWNTCTAINKMTFDYTTCSTDVAYSGKTSVTCIDTVPVGSENYVTVYNSGSFDNSATYQFSCFAVNRGLTTSSVAPKYCRNGQTSADYPVDTSPFDTKKQSIGAIVPITSVKEHCYTCPAPDAPTGGSVLVDTDGAVTKAYYTCNTGYALYGNTFRQCQANNTWTGATPACKCLAPVAPANGTVSVSSDGLTATYTCNVGFILNGNQYRTCQNTNAWNGTDPKCDTCSSLGNLTNGIVTLTSKGSTTVAAFTCNVGYTLVGSVNASCLQNLTWSNSKPTCALCANLSNPALGNFSLLTDGLQTTAKFTCTNGYKIKGIDALTCLTNGSWSASTPTCICMDPASPSSGNLTVDVSGMLASYTCQVGYTLNGSTTRTCQMNGSSWTGTAPTCVVCNNLTTTSGLNSTTSTNGVQTSVSFSCLPGYTLTGETNATCNTSGSWSQTATACVSCGTLASPTSGTVIITSNGTVSVATYTCNSGFTLSGSLTRVCQQNGIWSGAAAKCDCATLLAPTNGNVTVISNTAYYACAVNYTLSGQAVSVCESNGTGWSNPPPTCVLCAQIQGIANGSVSLVSQAGLTTNAKYTCNVGFTMVGGATVTCTLSGAWNATPPYCQQCVNISAPANGNVTLSTNGYSTVATFSCGVGFSVSDVTVVSSDCGQTGQWNVQNTTCVACPPLTNISSGTITLSSNGTLSTATYACATGYYVIGATTRTCRSNGTWSDTAPTCVCQSPSPIQNGSLLLSPDGMVASYSCDTGYSMKGVSNITCQSGGIGWSSSPPSCVRCDVLTNPAHGKVTMTTDRVTSTATYSCDTGYSLNNRALAVQTCNSIGVWTNTPPTCVACNTLSIPDSGNMTLTFNVTSTQAVFTCVNGYTLRGQAILICGQNGTWDSNVPQCVCNEPTPPGNGSLTLSSNGYSVTFSCDVGFSLNGVAVQNCQTNGQSWSASRPSCVKCASPPSISNGSTGLSTNGTVTVVTYSCDVGFTLSSVVGNTSGVCGDTGSWTIPNITCVKCSNLTSPSGGALSLSTDGFKTTATFSCTAGYYMVGANQTECSNSGIWTKNVPDCLCLLPAIPANGNFLVSADNRTLTLECNTGYILSGSSIRTCALDGSGWTGVQPSCRSCDPLSAPLGGSVNFLSNGTVTSAVFSCNVGSSMIGSRILTCLTSTSWDQNPPLCISCPGLVDPQSGSVSVTTNGSVTQAIFKCVSGYHVVGSDVIKCQTDGSWSASSAICLCNSPASPIGGSFILSSNGLTVTYSCDVGFTLSGIKTRQCAVNGTGWQGTQPFCVACPILTQPTSGTLNVTFDGTNSIGHFTCNLGYTLNGSALVTCSSSGIWESASPVCVKCSSLSSPDSGSVTMTTNGELTVAKYSCVTGYEINGQSTLSCNTSGLWSDAEPKCVCSPPNTPINGHVNISADGMTSSYTCNSGYTLEGVTVRTCRSSGAGWNEAQPSCKTCTALSNQPGGTISLSTSGTVTVATVTCQTGYTINGNSTLTCRSDGTWDLSTPSCTTCSSVSTPSHGSIQLFSDGSVTKANFTCSAGYSTTGSSLLTCRTDGNWDFGVPTCVKCANLSNVSSGVVSVATNGQQTYATVTCSGGYYISGGSVSTCGSDGLWNSTLPSCVCNPLSSPSKGSVIFTNAGMIAKFACNLGYTLVGNGSATCLTNGSGWTGSTPYCVGCPALPMVTNGTVVVETDGATTTWSLTCGVGTTLVGMANITCTEAGTWSSTQPACKQCASLQTPTNGTMSLNTDGALTVATYTCQLGYSINGSKFAVCLVDGSWNSSAPTCVQCKSLNVLGSGTIVYSSTGSATIATSSCASGYYLVGSSNITCKTDGTWSAAQPTCVCTPPVSIPNGDVWVSPDGMTLQYSCTTGYSLNGNNSNTCMTDGTGWSGTHPTCVKCQPIIKPSKGNYTLATNGTLSYSIFTCDLGYSLSSTASRVTCNIDGSWDQSSLTCVKCDPISSPGSGNVVISTNASTTIATYTCVTGYNLQGSSVRTCMTNGSWDISAPSCVCKSPGAPTNGLVSIPVDGMRATYTCSKGYTLNGSSQRDCAVDGTGWTYQQPSCVVCNTLSTVTGGSLVMWTDGSTTFANFTCIPGFTMDGQASIQCRSDGTWNFNPPSCVTCQSFTVAAGRSSTFSTDGQTTTVAFQCQAGYTMSGSQTAVCSTTGKWSNPEPVCVKCDNLISPNSGSVTVVTDNVTSVAAYTCTAGYYLMGKSVASCGTSGNWNFSTPDCVCNPPATPTNGAISISTNGTTVTYNCNSGSTLNGNSIRTCSSNGLGWNGTQPTCVTCQTLQPPANGTIQLQSNGTSTIINISCDVGFTSSGSVSLACQPNGTFNSPVPTCVKCLNLTAPNNGSIVLTTNSSQTTATVYCDVGYSLKGSKTLSCQQNGTWSATIPTCEKCSAFANITSGSFTISSNGSTTYVTAQCTSGYYLNGPTVVTCSENGIWSHTPACLCNDPATPVNGTMISTGDTATFTCMVGYTLSGSAVSLCRSDGGGWQTQTPSCERCKSLTSLTNGSSVMSTNGINTVIRFSCPVGYTLDGEVINECWTNGTWSHTVPSCVSCQVLSDPSSGVVALQTDNTTTTAVYSCATGYDLLGPQMRYCLNNGSWSHYKPACVCSNPTLPANGNVTVSIDRTTANYFCNNGFTLKGIAVRSCGITGTGWSGNAPTCSLCTTLTIPSGGTVTLSTDGITTTASFSCSSGYTMDGASSVSCRDDGSWNVSSPTCVKCETVMKPSNGAYITSTDGRFSVVRFTCDKGYTLVGTSALSCDMTGSYNDQEPTCIKCDPITTPDSGSLNTSTNGTVTVATFACSIGYYLEGHTAIACDTLGNWNDTEPQCLCNPPSTVANGYCNISSGGALAQYSCLKGFSLSGDSKRSCLTNGQGWNGSSPLCVACGNLQPPTNGSLVVTSDGTATSAVVSCTVGTTLQGDAKVKCLSNGTWTSSSISCVSCANLGSLSNGDILITTNNTVTSASFSCYLGYTLSGSDSSSCRTDGTWSLSKPLCVVCPAVTTINNGDVNQVTDGRTTFVEYACHSKYIMRGSSVLGCRTDGSWNESIPSCVCIPPLSLINGSYTISSDGMTLTYACDSGFTMVGSVVRTCGTDSSGWAGSPPTCTKCGVVTSIPNGDVSITTNGKISIATYSCYLGYSVQGAYIATCDGSGHWNVSAPSCAQCTTLGTITNGNVAQFTDGTVTTAEFSCLSGYYLVGNSVRHCISGVWNGTQPYCLCESTNLLANGKGVSNGSIISYTCNVGYSLNGVTMRTCQDDGKGWSLSEPTCTKCVTISTPAGGNLTRTSNGFTTIAQFSCNTGYTMSGTSTLTCGSDGNWDFNVPTCGVPCSPLSTVTGGKVTLHSDGITTTAVYTCDNNYTLNGKALLTCRSDGSWDFTQSNCVKCASILPPVNGYVNITTDGSETRASFRCHEGYYLKGASLSFCSTTGIWNSSVPLCICNAPAPITNGTVDVSLDGLTATITCSAGFTMYGDSLITCQDNNRGWTANNTVCVSCGQQPQIQNGSVTLVTDGLTSTLNFSCGSGYSINGQTSIQCNRSGQWIADFPKCVQCSNLQDIANGTTETKTNGHITVKSYKCNVSYTLKGASEISCLTNGTWSSAPPVCVRCNPLITPFSGQSNQTTDGLNTYTTFSCVSGYHLVGSSVIQCKTDGSWNGSEPICVCDVPVSPANAVLTFSSNNMVVDYSCKEGYSLKGNVQRQCQNNGSGWSDAQPSCVVCSSLAALTSGNSTLSTNGSVSSVEFSCGVGFTLKGESHVTCYSNGTWSSDVPKCVGCSSLVTPSSGTVNLTTNGTSTMATFSCLAGYSLVGQSTSSCLENGTWNVAIPQCVCKDPPSPVDGSVTADGHTAIFTCANKFTLRGQYIRYCQNDSSGWNGTNPTCVACASLISPAGGSVAVVTTGQVTTAHYTCDKGYTISGTNNLTCRSDGTWDYSSASCVTCATLSPIDNGRLELVSVNSVTYADFTCEPGYTLKGYNRLTCRTSGSWDFSEPNCVACNPLGSTLSGNQSIITNGTQSVVYYTCAAGYYLEGNSNRSCGTNGVWSGSSPSCKCDLPQKPNNGSLSVSSDGSVVTFNCDIRFTLVGSSVLRCHSDGSGWNGTAPTCVQCNIFNVPSNGSISYTTNNLTTSVSVSCDVGTTLVGNPEISCGTSGQWEIQNNVSCVSCPIIANIKFGSTAITTNGTLTKASFSCSLGYSMSGASELSCTQTGQWSGTTPSCSRCSLLTEPSLSFKQLAYSTDGSVTSAKASCVDGYHTVGQTSINCINGTWNGSLPNCVCDALSTPLNGIVSVSGDQLTTAFTCNPGYTMMGSATSACHTNGTGWSSGTPTCVACSSLPSVNGSISTVTSNGTVSVISYSCGIGSTINGNSQRSCDKNGLWMGAEPVCVSCPALVAPSSGNVTLQTSGQVTTALYSCVSGYELSGSSVRECLTNASWSFIQPVCNCKLPAAPPSGVVKFGTHVNTAVYTCNEGYSLKGHSERFCQSDGTGWNLTSPECVACSTLPSTSGGTFIISTDGTTSTALYQCQEGYTMKGTSKLECRSDGTWNIAAPVCEPCATLTPPTGTTIEFNTDGSVTSAGISCANGYTLSGSSNLTCRSDGSWNLSPGSCVKCPTLLAPESGYVNITSDGTVTTAVFRCASGYYVDGSAMLTCLTAGQWDDKAPLCKCTAPNTIANGHFVILNNGTSALYRCDVGFSMNGSSTLTCQNNGLGWNSLPPTCYKCKDFSSYLNGTVTLTTTGNVTTATFTCGSGYSISGSSEIKCLPNGSWELQQPTCVKCGNATVPANGSVQWQTDNSTSKAVFSCMAGSSLVGSASLTCSPNGTLIGNSPSCVACPNLTDPRNGHVAISTNSSISKAMFSCNANFTLVGNETSLCVNGSWNSAPPSCECSAFSKPPNGDIAVSADGLTATYTCGAGFTLSGEVQQICASPSSISSPNKAPTCITCVTLNNTGASYNLTTNGSTTTATFQCGAGYTLVGATTSSCRSDGTWSASEPTCVSCTPLTPPTDGKITLRSDGSHTSANVSCGVGYTLSGTANITCRIDGSWDFSPATCVVCPVITAPNAGTVNISTNGIVTIAVFECFTGYYIKGPSTISCKTNGFWNDSQPTCLCKSPSVIQNGSFVISSDGLSITYSCEPGCSMSGNATRSCSSTGTGWSSVAPTCNKCSALNNQQNGLLTITSNGVSTQAIFTCTQGYTISGPSVIECKSDGTWDVQQPTCVKCLGTIAPTNGSYALSSNGTVTISKYLCGTGFTLKGSSAITCSSNGSWTYPTPSCVSCPTLSEPENGKVNLTSDGSVTIATYTCNQDYSIIGKSVLACTTSGSWNGTAPTCVCSSFVQPSNGKINISANGTKATYTCDPGFTLGGNVEQTCGVTVTVGNVTSSPPTCTACNTLSNTGASYNLTSDGFVTTAMFKCDTGYTLVGETTSLCRNDGTWSASVPTCVSCISLAPPAGGQIILHSDGSDTTATVSCAAGYTLSGASNLTCKMDGTWNFSPATCVACPALAAPNAGTVHMWTDGFFTTAIFNCTTGYYVKGKTSISCGINGLWNDSPPTCLCNPPDVINNGSYVISSDGFTVTYSCYQGFSMSGNASRSCNSTGAGWSSVAPTCSKCGSLASHQNGTVTIITDGLSTQAIYTCAQGYTISGFSLIRCKSDGTWDVQQPTCEKCSTTVAPTNGTYSLSSNGTVTVSKYSCGIGFSLKGPIEVACSSNGSWTSQTPSCVSCPVLSDPENGKVNVTSDGTVTIAMYTCNQDYSIRGRQVLSCSTSGTWNGTAPTCVCSAFVQPSHGKINISANGTKATYTCDPGFTLSGSVEQTCGVSVTLGNVTSSAPTCTMCKSLNTSSAATFSLLTDGTRTVAKFQCPSGYTMVGSSNLTCRTDGSWDSAPPYCKTCDSLPVVVGGNTVLASNGLVTQATFICGTGTTLSGQGVLSCRIDGTWDFQQPNCVQCPSITDPVNGFVNVTSSGQVSMALFTCTSGYHVNGNSSLTCLESGRWNHPIPTCNCDTPPAISNGTFTLSSDGEISYACNLGYTLSGVEKRTCAKDGTGWNGTQPSCKMCLSISTSTGRAFALTTNGTATKAQFTCNTGSTLNGVETLTCLSNGSWSGTLPSCATCQAFTSKSNGSITYETNGTVTSSVFRCQLGSTLFGNSKAACNADGSWSSVVPSCVSCPTLSNPSHGAVNISTDGSVTTASFTCVAGYSLVGALNLKCLINGSWDSLSPTCACDSFTPPLNGKIVVAANGSQATYGCDAGYSLSGEVVQTCATSTTSSPSSSSPTCVSCKALASVSGSQVVMSTSGAQTIATYSCEQGYVMIGERTLTCRSDGSWNYSPPRCEICDKLGSVVGGNVTLSSDGRNTTALFTCVNGFTLKGSRMLTCKADGSWDFDQPFCECNEPVSPANGLHKLSADKLTATYTCNAGYTLSGPASRQCKTDGTWWSGSDPSCVTCGSLAAGPGMNITLLTDGTSTRAHFRCDTGYSISHTNNVTCLQNGSWSHTLPTCIRCTPLNTSSATSFIEETEGSSTSAKFTCASGYEISGAQTIQCLQDGSWSTSQPTCEKISADAVQSCATGNSGAAIALGILFALAFIAAVILGVVAWRYWRKYQLYGKMKGTPYVKEDVKFNPIFTDMDRSAFTPSKAPVSHARHVTDMGRSDTSLAPRGHHKHVIDSTSIDAAWSPAPLSTRNIELQRPPMMTGRKSPSRPRSRSPVTSATPSSLGETSLGNYLPEQILTPRTPTSVPAVTPSSLDIPVIDVDAPKPKKNNKDRKKPRNQSEQTSPTPKLSPFMPIKEGHVYREGSPLPQQILTPRHPADYKEKEHSHNTNGTGDIPRPKRQKKPKGDLIDKDKNFLQVHERKGSTSPILRTPSPAFEQSPLGTEIDHEVSDIEV